MRLSLLLASLVLPCTLLACRGAGSYRPPSQARELAPVIAQVLVLGGGQPPGSFDASTELEVEKIWKGSFPLGKTTLKSTHDTCGPYPFTKGERYLLYFDPAKGSRHRILRATPLSYPATQAEIEALSARFPR